MITKETMEATIRRYFDGCNLADIDMMVGCMVPEAVHYFPPGMYGGPFRGSHVIAQRWAEAVEKLGSYWTVDSFVGDPDQHAAVIEWTHFKRRAGVVLRGDEWYRFDPSSGLITEIRAYYASPQTVELDALELQGFDYAGRGYALDAPPLD